MTFEAKGVLSLSRNECREAETSSFEDIPYSCRRVNSIITSETVTALGDRVTEKILDEFRLSAGYLSFRPRVKVLVPRARLFSYFHVAAERFSRDAGGRKYEKHNSR